MATAFMHMTAAVEPALKEKRHLQDHEAGFGSLIVFFSLHFRSIFYLIFAVNATLTIVAFGSLLGYFGT